MFRKAVGCIGVGVAVTLSLVGLALRVDQPHLTETELLLEYPRLWGAVVVACVVGWWGSGGWK